MDYEKLGAFYLGREVDPDSGQVSDIPLLYDSRDLTTHGVIIGMTGSGKTGLCISLIEEAAIDGVPAILIDPKGTPHLPGEVRHGTRGGRPDVRLLGGYFVFASPDAGVLVSLLPRLVHVRGVERLALLVRLAIAAVTGLPGSSAHAR